MWPQLTVLFALNAHAATVPDLYPTLAAAVTATPPGGVIEVAPGYWPGSVSIDKDLEIRGTGHAVDTILAAQGNTALRITNGAQVVLRNLTVDGVGAYQGMQIETNAHVLFEDARCVNARGPDLGGCVRMTNASLHTSRAVFQASHAQWGGAHVYAYNSDLLLEESRFTGASGNDGASMFLENTSVTISDSRFGANVAPGYAGAIVAINGSMSLADTWFHDNSGGYGTGALYVSDIPNFSMVGGGFVNNISATGQGGAAIIQYSPDARFERTVFRNNATRGQGGALYAISTTNLNIDEAWVVDNSSTSSAGGGLFFSSVQQGSVTNSLLRYNWASGNGGGLAMSGGSGALLSGNVLCNNVSSANGGGIHAINVGYPNITTSVFMYNQANTRGGGMYVENGDFYAYRSYFLMNAAWSYEGAHIYGTSNNNNYYYPYASQNLYAWADYGIGLMYGYNAFGGFYSEWDWYNENWYGDYENVYTWQMQYGNPHLTDFYPYDYSCTPRDLRPGPNSLLPSASYWGPIGPWDGAGNGPRWHEDLDNDGYVGLEDCNDRDPALNPNTVWYRDADADGYGDAGQTYVGCTPLGYDWVLIAGDCDDTDPRLNTLTTVYDDLDGDGFGNPATGRLECGIPAGTVLNGDDCDDTDALSYPGQIWYTDADADGFGNSATAVSCQRPPNGVLVGGDCNDGNSAVYPGANEVCNGIDDSCNNLVDDADPALDLSTASTWYADADGDGLGDPATIQLACLQPVGFVVNADDCDDSDPSVGLPVQLWVDGDGDGYGDMSAAPIVACPPQAGYALNALDCDDSNPLIHPNTVWYFDGDGDGYGDAAAGTVVQCEQPAGFALLDGDCDDDDDAVNPGATEVCNGIDDNCTGLVDDEDPDLDLSTTLTWYQDADNDGFGDASVTTQACEAPAGFVADASDCDDTDPLINPAAPEQCDEIDHNCDGDPAAGVVDLTWHRDADGDGWGVDTDTTVDCARPDGYVLASGDCDDTDPLVNPGMLEVCNGIDDNCDGQVDVGAIDAQLWAPDADGDGFGDSALVQALCEGPRDWVNIEGDCDDNNPNIYPGAPEVCNGRDNDCNGLIDDNAIDEVVWYADADGDGWGDEDGATTYACNPPIGFGPPGDCDDDDAAIHPGAPEICNGIDDNCSLLVDDEDPALTRATTWWPDADGDGYGDPNGEPVVACEAPLGHVANNDDCDDTDATVQACEEPGDTGYTPIDLDPPSSGKSDVVKPTGPGRYGLGCATSGPAVPGWAVLFGALLLVRRRRASGPALGR